MKIFKVGDVQKAVCEHCAGFQLATFKLRNVPMSDGLGVVKSVLVGVCDSCDSVVLIPHQSAPQIKQQIERKKSPVEARVPAHMIDILNLASEELGASSDFVPSLLKFYIHSLSANEMSMNSIARYTSSDLFSGKAEKRLSLKGQHLLENIESIKSATELSKTTDLLKSIILKIKDDILDDKKPAIKESLKMIVASTA